MLDESWALLNDRELWIATHSQQYDWLDEVSVVLMGASRLRLGWIEINFVSDSPCHVTEGQTKNANDNVFIPKAKVMGAAAGR